VIGRTYFMAGLTLGAGMSANQQFGLWAPMALIVLGLGFLGCAIAMSNEGVAASANGRSATATAIDSDPAP